MGLRWQALGACRGLDPDVFFPERGGSMVAATWKARRVCAGCPVRLPCLEHALEWPEKLGVWGGTTEQERRRLRRLARARLVS